MSSNPEELLDPPAEAIEPTSRKTAGPLETLRKLIDELEQIIQAFKSTTSTASLEAYCAQFTRITDVEIPNVVAALAQHHIRCLPELARLPKLQRQMVDAIDHYATRR